MINAISLEKERYEKLMPIVADTDMKVITLCMSDADMPQTVDDRMKIADELVGGLLKNNVKVENIFVNRWFSRCRWMAPSVWSSSTRLRRSWRTFRASTPLAG